MNWDDLRYFLAVAETETLAGAARRLDVNHSTVFRRINRFEQQLGSVLFERLPDGYQLTLAGEELFRHAQAIGAEVDRLALKLHGKDFRPSGTVRLTAPEHIANAYLPGYLADFRERYPDIAFEIDVGAASRDLTRREADLAIRATNDPPPHLVGLRTVLLNWSCYASAAYLDRFGVPANAAALKEHRVIGADGALRRLAPFRDMEADELTPTDVRCSTLNSMAAMAIAGLGVALLPDDQDQPALKRLFPCAPAYASDLWLLTHPELRHTERIRLLMSHLQLSFRNDPRLDPSRFVD